MNVISRFKNRIANLLKSYLRKRKKDKDKYKIVGQELANTPEKTKDPETKTVLEAAIRTPENRDERAYRLIAGKEWGKLAKLGDSSIEPLIQTLQNSNSDAQKSALETLGKIGEEKVKESIIEVLKGASISFW